MSNLGLSAISILTSVKRIMLIKSLILISVPLCVLHAVKTFEYQHDYVFIKIDILQNITCIVMCLNSFQG